MKKPKNKIERVSIKVKRNDKIYLITAKGVALIHPLFDPSTKIIIEIER